MSDFDEYGKDNSQNCIVASDVPDVTKEEPCWMGIDEAGRGPVLGPMVYGTAYCPIAKLSKLKELGLADSKTLTEEQREKMFTMMNESKDEIGWIVHILSPSYISNSMLRRFKYNLNELSHDTAIGLIRKVLDKGVNLKEVYVDTVGLPEKYQAKLKEIFPDLDITVAKKADAIYPIVSGASICAKVARDRVVTGWKFVEGIDVEDFNFGSGYPGDPNTKKFMANYMDPVFGFPNFVRFSWSTASVILDDKAAPMTWEDEDDDSDKKFKAKNTPSVSAYFATRPEDEAGKKNTYFTNRCLKQVASF